jgi:hypothetical protein
MTAKAPTLTPGPSLAHGSTTAVGWMEMFMGEGTLLIWGGR